MPPKDPETLRAAKLRYGSTYRQAHREELREKDRLRSAKEKAERLRVAETENMAVILVEKRCATCKLFKDLDDFTKATRHIDGKSYYCRECQHKQQALRREKNGEALRAYDRAKHARRMAEKRRQEALYKEEHAEEIEKEEEEKREERRKKKSAQDKAYREANPEKVKASKKTPRYLEGRALRYAKNREAHRAYMVDYNRKNRGKHVGYHKAHPEIKRAAEARRRAKKKAENLVHDLSAPQILEVFQAMKFRCAYCNKKFTARQLTIDHLTPIGPDGPTTLHNVIAACRPCNAKKQRGPVLQPVQPLLLTLASPKKPKKKPS